jgi:hypothetical protein
VELIQKTTINDEHGVLVIKNGGMY